MEIREIFTIVEETYIDIKPLETPWRKVAAIAVIKNPLAGSYYEDLKILRYDIGSELGTLLTEKALKALDVKPEEIESYGKAAVVGLDGELEHGSSILHGGLEKSFGLSIREALPGGGKSKAIIRSVEKKSGPGSTVDVPMCNRHAESVRSHYSSMEVKLTDCPRGDEIVVILTLSTGGRSHARIGGLSKENIVGEDGLK